MCPSEPPIAGEQRRRQRFGERYVGSIVRRHRSPQGPDTAQQRRMRVPLDGEITKVSQCKLRTCGEQRCGLREPPQRLCHFDVDEVRRVQLLGGMQHPGCDALGELCSQHQLDRRRRIDHYQRASRSARSAWVGESLPP